MTSGDVPESSPDHLLTKKFGLIPNLEVLAILDRFNGHIMADLLIYELDNGRPSKAASWLEMLMEIEEEDALT